MVTKPDRLSEAACCVISAVKTVLERHGIPIPERQAISHKGLDDECADCSGIFVSSPSSTSAEVVNPDGKCVKVRQFRFQIDVLRKVCTEAIDPCGDQYGGCDETVDNPLPDGPDLDEPCCKPPPFRLPPELCEEPTGEPYTVMDETVYFWRERYVLEKELCHEIKCCLERCHLISCREIDLGEVFEETLGGCHYLTLSLDLIF